MTATPPPPGAGYPPPGATSPPLAPPPPWQQPPPGAGYALAKAGWWTRVAAVLVDLVIGGLLLAPGLITLAVGPWETTTCTDGGRVYYCEEPTDGTFWLMLLFLVAGTGAFAAYWAVLEGRRTQSLGKRALGIRTVDATTGQAIGPGRAVGRFFARVLSQFACGLGYLWALWDPQKQTFHDKVVGTVVVKG